MSLATSINLATGAEQTPGGESGLTFRQAEQALAQYGANDPMPARGRSRIHDLALLLLNPLVVILLIASTVSAFLGEVVSASIIATVVLLGIGINFAQTYRSQLAIEALRKRVVMTFCLGTRVHMDTLLERAFSAGRFSF